MKFEYSALSSALALCLTLSLSTVFSASAQDQPIADPLPSPTPAPIALTLEEFVTIPASDTRANNPSTRIVYLSELPDGSGHLMVPDLNGPVWLIVDGEPIEYLDVSEQIEHFAAQPGIGTGLAFLAFHPDFAGNGLFYTAHSEAGEALTTLTPDMPYPGDVLLHGVVTEWQSEDPGANQFSGSHRELMRIGLLRDNHGMQQVGFNPTAAPGDADYGKLYIALGESERPANWSDAPQNLSMPHGKILRIDPLGNNSANGQYGIPADNPFVGQDGALGEIYIYGMRNPHRFSWDPATKKMYVGMLGESSIESMYEVEAGDNLGWNLREGPFLFNHATPLEVYPLPEDDANYGFVYPVASYDHDNGNAISAGFAYRGEALPELQGKFLFGDVRNGFIRYAEIDQMQRGQSLAEVFEPILLDAEGNQVTMFELADFPRVDLRFGIDAEGEIYVLTKGHGKIWKITDATPVNN